MYGKNTCIKNKMYQTQKKHKKNTVQRNKTSFIDRISLKIVVFCFALGVCGLAQSQDAPSKRIKIERPKVALLSATEEISLLV